MPNMLQDSLRSVVYRSFVTCDDPNGVECSTIRRSKSKGKNKHHKTKGSSSTSTSYEEERKDSINKEHTTQASSSTSTSYEEERTDSVPSESTEELQNLSSFQIREVSKGAQKLNDVIGSWSNETSFDEQSNSVAKDLLKGALHLQESLVMLGKLQEASRLMAKPKKRHKERAEGGRFDGEGTGLTDCNLLGENVQKSRISADQSSRDCYDELREVIRESFARQNLLPKMSANERDSLDRKRLDFGVDYPSTSSSQSSLIPGHSSDSSPSNVQREKPKGPNLIAKLMGLEEVSSKSYSSVVHRQFLKRKLPNQRSYLVDIDLARPRKPQFMAQKAVRERRTLEEMIETMQFKGLLGRSIDGSNHDEDFSDVCVSRKCSVVVDPPIVIMKPRQVPDLRAEDFHANYEEKPISSRRMPRKRMVKFPPSTFDVQKAQLKFTKTNDKLPAGITLKQKIKEDKETRLSGELPGRLVKKTLQSQNNMSPMKINHCKTVATKVQKKDEIVKKIDSRTTKGDSNNRKQAETKDDKSQQPAKTQDLVKATALKLSKAGKGSNVAKVQVTQGEKTAIDRHMKPKSPKSSVPKKTLPKSKHNSKNSAALVENEQSDDNLPTNIESHTLESLRSARSEKIIKEVTNARYDPIPDNSGDANSASCESSGPTIKVDAEHIEDGICSPCLVSDEINCCKSITHTKYLLLSSKSFLNHAKELFNSKPCELTVLPTTWLSEDEMLDTPILFKCAEEILERKLLRHAINPLSQNLTKPKCHFSPYQLVEEICDEIEELRNYSKSCSELILADVYSMLKRDLSVKGGVIGNWDLGWGNCFTLDQVNEVVNDVEKLVLNEIVDDAIAQLI